MSSKFSAHKTPLEFAEWIMNLKGVERYNNLKAKSKQVWDKNYEKVITYLDEQEKLLTKK